MTVDDLAFIAFVRELTPGWLAATAALAGEEPFDSAAPFRWVQLGSRAGVTPAVVAATHPHAEIWVAEADPGVTARARRLGVSAGLDNLVIEHRDEIATGVPDEIDVLVVDDVFSTVPPEVARRIVELIRRQVRPGGFVITAFRPLAGWALLQPIATLMRLAAEKQPGPLVSAVPAAVALVEHLRELGAHHLATHPHVTDVIDALAGMGNEDVARLFMGPTLDPLTPTEVAAQLSEAGCTFVANARLLDADTIPPSLRSRFEAASSTQQQLLLDLATGSLLRIDVFRKGSVPPTSLSDALAGLVLAAVEPAGANDSAEGDGADVLDLEPWGEVAVRLGDQAGELLARNPQVVATATRQLLRDGRARPVISGGSSSDAATSCARLTDVLSHVPGFADRVVAPAVGSLVSTEVAKRLAHLREGPS